MYDGEYVCVPSILCPFSYLAIQTMMTVILSMNMFYCCVQARIYSDSNSMVQARAWSHMVNAYFDTHPPNNNEDIIQRL